MTESHREKESQTHLEACQRARYAVVAADGKQRALTVAKVKKILPFFQRFIGTDSHLFTCLLIPSTPDLQVAAVLGVDFQK